VCVGAKLASAMQSISTTEGRREVRVCAKLESAMQPISATEGRTQQSIAWSQGYGEVTSSRRNSLAFFIA